MIITPTSLSINQLFGSANEQYSIPAYQRRYSWHERQVNELIDDIKLIEGNDTHLLGSIVCLAGHHTAGLNRLELVDGQQRLTTVAILLECIRQRLEREDEADEAADVGRLLMSKALGGKPLRKIALDSIDSPEFDFLVDHKLDHEFKNRFLKDAFQIIRHFISMISLSELGTFLYRLKNQAIVIRLDVGEAKDAFKLFETINNRGLRLNATDIIKNFLLGNAARFGGDSLDLARSNWAALISNLDGTNSDAFFRYYLMALAQTRVTTSRVVSQFKSIFMQQVTEAALLPERPLYFDDEYELEDEEGSDPSLQGTLPNAPRSETVSFNAFLVQLIKYAKVYGELVLVNTKDQKIDRRLRNLKMIKAVQTYGFLMHLRVGGCSDQIFLEVLKLTERFVLRPHICRERSNDTETLFARLCKVNPQAPLAETKAAYRDLCPSDDRFKEDFAETNFPPNLIDRARYCLEQIEISKHGSHTELQVLGSDDVHVEHIIPKKITTRIAKEEFGDWVQYLGTNAETRHQKLVSRIGNLTLVAGNLNIGASNNPFNRKKEAYKNSSIKITNELCEYPSFKFIDVTRRSEQLAEDAVNVWPMP